MITLHDNPDSAQRYAQRRFEQEAPPAHPSKCAAPLRQKAREMVEATIGNHPVASFGVALFTGIALGWWIKRR